MTIPRPRVLSRASVSQKCTLGCPVLDAFLRGGIPCGAITELVGESTAAKTQVCLQLALAVQLHESRGGLSASAVYIHTEGSFPLKRLRQLARCQVEACRSTSPSHPPSKRARLEGWNSQAGIEPWRELDHVRSNGASCEDPCDRIFIKGIQEVDELLDLLEHGLPTFLQQRRQWPIRLIVIDSIAAVFRTEFDHSVHEYAERAGYLFKVATLLKRYADEYDLAVVVTNQVTAHIEDEGSQKKSQRQQHPLPLVSSGRRVLPALGLAWSNCVSMRLFLSIVSKQHEERGSHGGTRRQMQVVFAPHLPSSLCEFTVCAAGVKGMVSSWMSKEQ